MNETAPEIQILTRTECLDRLASRAVGRIALPGAGAPILRPVNFALVDERVFIRTGEGTILDAAERGDPASFEVDSIDMLEHTGMSVVVVGKLLEYDPVRDAPAPAIRAWASGVKDRLVVLSIDEVSGMNIPPGRGNR